MNNVVVTRVFLGCLTIALLIGVYSSISLAEKAETPCKPEQSRDKKKFINANGQGLNLEYFCDEEGTKKLVSLVNKLGPGGIYGWKCSSSDGSAKNYSYIDPYSVCLSQYKSTNTQSLPKAFNKDPYDTSGWSCECSRI